MIIRDIPLTCYKIFVLIITYTVLIYLWIKISLAIYLVSEALFN